MSDNDIIIWVWLYDYGPLSVPNMWPKDTTKLAYPQAHGRGFLSKAEAIEYASKYFSDPSLYTLQKVRVLK